jgi:hypothetical protein
MDLPENIPCFKCGGRGVIPFPSRLKETLAAVWETPGQDAQGLHRRLAVGEEAGIAVTAINNRLVTLEELGLIRREGRGRHHNPHRWFPVVSEHERQIVLVEPNNGSVCEAVITCQPGLRESNPETWDALNRMAELAAEAANRGEI